MRNPSKKKDFFRTSLYDLFAWAWRRVPAVVVYECGATTQSVDNASAANIIPERTTRPSPPRRHLCYEPSASPCSPTDSATEPAPILWLLRCGCWRRNGCWWWDWQGRGKGWRRKKLWGGVERRAAHNQIGDGEHVMAAVWPWTGNKREKWNVFFSLINLNFPLPPIPSIHTTFFF
jgi:hypothetical protein